LATIKTVGPGKDFETLSDWELFARTQNNGQIAECYSGANLGQFNPASWSFPGAWYDPHIIRVAHGHKHKGKIPTNINNVAHIKVSGTAIAMKTSNQNFFVIDGLYIEHEYGQAFVKGLSGLWNHFQNNFTNHLTGTGSVSSIQYRTNINGFAGFIRNNIILISGGSTARVIWGRALNGKSVDMAIQNNCLYCSPSASATWGIILRRDGGGGKGDGGVPADLDVTAHNNIAFNCHVGSGMDISYAGGGALFADSNATSDLSIASTVNPLTNQDSNDWLVDPGVNFNQLKTSPGIDSGRNLSTALWGPFNFDALGASRPKGKAWDRGPIERFKDDKFPAIASPGRSRERRRQIPTYLKNLSYLE